MKIVRDLDEWRENMDETRFKIINWAYNINSGRPGEIKLTAVITLGVIAGFGAVFYYIGMQNLARVFGIIAGLQLFSLLYGKIKELFRRWMKQSFIKRFK